MDNALICTFCRRIWSKERSYSLSSWYACSGIFNTWSGRPKHMRSGLFGSGFLCPVFDFKESKLIASGKESKWQKSGNAREQGFETVCVLPIAKDRHFSEQKASPMILGRRLNKNRMIPRLTWWGYECSDIFTHVSFNSYKKNWRGYMQYKDINFAVIEGRRRCQGSGRKRRPLVMTVQLCC